MGTKKFLVLGAFVLVLALILIVTACQGAAGPQGPAGPAGPSGPAGAAGSGGGGASDITKATIQASRGPLTALQLAEIQPGLGTVMIEYATRFDNLWFSAQKGNWDMTRYQIKEMTEIQEVAETTRPARVPMLKAFESGFLDPLDKAAQSKDLTAFTTAYDKAIGGCNGCHAASSSGDWPNFKFVKVTRPTAPNFNNIDWAGQ